MIREWAPVFPAYDLASNKGYRSPTHIASLRRQGPSPLHRQSFAPVWMAASPQEVLEFMHSQVEAGFEEDEPFPPAASPEEVASQDDGAEAESAVASLADLGPA
jgi:hypothetical protein